MRGPNQCQTEFIVTEACKQILRIIRDHMDMEFCEFSHSYFDLANSDILDNFVCKLPAFDAEIKLKWPSCAVPSERK